jgi:hypothetical protein
MLWEGNVD